MLCGVLLTEDGTEGRPKLSSGLPIARKMWPHPHCTLLYSLQAGENLEAAQAELWGGEQDWASTGYKTEPKACWGCHEEVNFCC